MHNKFWGMSGGGGRKVLTDLEGAGGGCKK